jgi:hypothetical protein
MSAIYYQPFTSSPRGSSKTMVTGRGTGLTALVMVGDQGWDENEGVPFTVDWG